MDYPDGQQVRLGDELELRPGSVGIVVCSIDTDEYTPDYPKKDWSYLGKGVLIESEEEGLTHYEMTEPEFRLIKRF